MRVKKLSATIPGFFGLVAGTLMAFVLSLRAPASENSLPVRDFGAVAHNTVTHQFILFGGVGNGPDLDDTWVWQKTGWKEGTPIRHPEPRHSAAMAYDDARGEVVLFGGLDQHSRRTASAPWAIVRAYPPALHQEGTVVFYRDTWIWDGTDWARRDSAQSPSARSSHAMAYDAARKQIVLFGGLDDQNGTPLHDTWVWDGDNWKKMNPTNAPEARELHAMAYDPIRQLIVMFGGKTSEPNGHGGGHSLNDTWLWDGRNWTKAEPPGDLPQQRYGAGLDYDPIRRRLVLISGFVDFTPVIGAPANDAWTWDGERWAKLPLRAFELSPDSSKLDPSDTDGVLIVNATAMPMVWVSKHVPTQEPAK